MALSRAAFGQRGNLLPGSLIWMLYAVLPKPAVGGTAAPAEEPTTMAI